jgi:hypothetical protein
MLIVALSFKPKRPWFSWGVDFASFAQESPLKQLLLLLDPEQLLKVSG